MSGAIGIDLGSQTCVIAAVNKGGIDVLTNDLSNRATPSVVGFTDKQRSLGESGYSKLSTNFRNTVLYPTRFIGLSPSSPNLEEEKKWITHPINTDTNEILHEVRYTGEARQFSTEKVLAMLLTHLEEIVSLKNKIKVTDCVISVPNYFNEVERIGVLNAITISGIPCVKIMNEGTAAALNYGLFRNNEFTETPRIVAFVDMGHSKFSVTIAQFVKDKLEVLTHWSDRALGGRDFDWVIMQYFASIFEKKHGINLLKNQRAKMKMAIAVEKIRKTLSANSDAVMNLEYITEDLDLTGIITRDELENLSSDLLDRVEKNCKIALQRAGVQSVHSVEILGGSSRMGIVQQVYAKAFQVEQVHKTLNPEEAISRGCAVQAAMLSPMYKVRDFTIKDIVYYPLKFYYTPKDMEVDSQAEVLFDEKNTFPVTKIINTSKNGPFRIRIFNEVSGTSSNFLVDCPEEPNEYKIKVHIKMDRNGVLSLEKAERIEKAEAEPNEKMDEDKKTEETKDSQPKTEESKEEDQKKKNKVKVNKIPLKTQNDLRGMDEDSLKKAIELEVSYATRDRTARETSDKKNELESYIYESRSNLNSYLKEYTTPDSLSAILEFLQKTEDWLYDEGTDTTKEKYQEKLSILKDFIVPIVNRYNAYNEIPGLIINVENAIKYSYDQFASIDDKYSHITESDRQAFINKAKENQEYLASIKELLSKKTKFEDPGVNTEDLGKRAVQQREVTNQVMSRPKPPPPKVEEKPAEPKPEEVKNPEPKAEDPKPNSTEETKDEKPMEVD
jgi:heat shock 70kDa protein 4